MGEHHRLANGRPTLFCRPQAGHLPKRSLFVAADAGDALEHLGIERERRNDQIDERLVTGLGIFSNAIDVEIRLVFELKIHPLGRSGGD